MMRAVLCLLLSVTFTIQSAEPSCIARVIGNAQCRTQPALKSPAKDGDRALPGAWERVLPELAHVPSQTDHSASAPNSDWQLEKVEFVGRGRLGVSIVDVGQGLADTLGLPGPGGSLVVSVDQYGAAAAAGIERGDVILELNDRPITKVVELAAAIVGRAPGTTVRLGIWRNHELQTVRATLGFWTITS
jgi:C-terminal processing protease CtpA/Prc